VMVCGLHEHIVNKLMAEEGRTLYLLLQIPCTGSYSNPATICVVSRPTKCVYCTLNVKAKAKAKGQLAKQNTRRAVRV